MLTDFSDFSRHLPCGIIITDNNLQIHFANDFAREKILQQHEASGMDEYVFHTTDMRVFDMHECMQSMISEGKRDFQKTLILKTSKREKLLFFSVRGVQQGGEVRYIFVITDISNEMDCITHSPGTFGKGEFLLRKKIAGNDPKVLEVFRMISLAADTDVNVLIQGESGTGKELVADAIHELSARKNKPFVKVNCAALSETLLESELFGHVKGAFTGAYKDKTGKFEQANGGTIFLDEIGEISQALQVKLLRVLQEKTIEKVGGNTSIKVDMRIVAATNKNLRELIRDNTFRDDLFYRINVFNILMPSLRDRKLDIPLLSDYFVEKFNKSFSRNVKGISRNALKILMDYSWPGNIRELQNAIEHAFVLVNGNVIEAEDLPSELRNAAKAEISNTNLLYPPDRISASVYYAESFRKSKNGRLKICREQLENVLEINEWNQSRSAEYLGISRVALWKKMKKMGLK